MQASAEQHRASSDAAVRNLLGDVARRRQSCGRIAATLGLAWRLQLTVLVLVLVDAAWPLASIGRAMLLGAVFAAGSAGAILMVRQRRDSIAAVARRLEIAHDRPTNPLINAVQLPNQPRVTAHGWKALQGMDPEGIMDRTRLRRHTELTTAVLLAWLALGLALPRLVGGGLLRLADPWGDHPPFSLTRLDVSVSPAEVWSGDDATVAVTVGGRAVEQAELVELDEGGEPSRRWAMPRAGERAFVRTLVDVREPMAFRVEAGSARSRRHAIVPQTRREAATRALEEARGAADDRDSIRAALRELERLTTELLREATEAAADFDWQAWRQKVGELEAMRAGLATHAGELAAVVPAAAATDEAIMQWLARLRDAVAAARGRLGDSIEATDSGRLVEGGSPAIEPPVDHPLATGRYDEVVRPGEVDVSPQRAAIELAPRAYRRLVADYFRLLAQPAPTQERH